MYARIKVLLIIVDYSDRLSVNCPLAICTCIAAKKSVRKRAESDLCQWRPAR